MSEEYYIPEVWKRIKFEDNISENEKYEISNYGRIKSLKQLNRYPQGKIIKQGHLRGYKWLPVKKKDGKRTARYVHKLVAETFIEKDNEEQIYVIHLDYDKGNNHVLNLKWATREEKERHQFNNPIYKDPITRPRVSKLSIAKVKLIKRKLNDPKRKTRMKMIAKQFGISEMQLYRIKTGENWGEITPD